MHINLIKINKKIEMEMLFLQTKIYGYGISAKRKGFQPEVV